MSRATLSVLATLFSLQALSSELTVVIHTEDVFSPEARLSMESEAGRILKHAGVDVQFVDWPEAARKTFENLVVFRMTGRCAMDGPAANTDDRGPYASAAVAGGSVLPFGEVRCNRIRESILRAMTSRDQPVGNVLLGRAIGRVMVHEVYHMVGNTVSHGKEGIAEEALSPHQLIANRLNLANRDCTVLANGRDFRNPE